MTLMKHDPNNLLQEWFSRHFSPTWERGWPHHHAEEWALHADILEAKDHYLITIDAPGIGPDDINITAENDILYVKCHREIKHHETKDDFVLTERASGTVIRQFMLPHMDTNKIKAHMEKGVLHIHINKHTKSGTHKVKISVKD
jgi:HSP20 family protein